MRRAGRAPWTLAAALLAALAHQAPAAQRPAILPDASQAQVDGQIAVGLWPMEGGEIVSPTGFTVHLADDESLEVEHVFPAGTWFLPPPGRYKVWTEGRLAADAGARISPTFTLLTYSGGPFQGRGFAGRDQVAKAGSVRLDPAYSLQPSQSLRLFHLDAANTEGARTRGFLRAVPANRADQPVLMPTGKIVGLVYDLKNKRYVAASQPVTVSTRGTARVLPVARQGVSDLLAILHRQAVAKRAAEDPPGLHLLETDGRRRPPDVLVPTWEWIYALWYDVPGRSVEVEAATPAEYLPGTEVVLRPGGVATLRAELVPRPHLDVRLELPPELVPRRATLELERRDDRQRVLRRSLPARAGVVTRLEGLPAADLAAWLVLDSDPVWKMWQRVDLSDGESREVVFQPRPILLTGTIYHGDEPTPAELTVQTLNEQGMDLAKATLRATVDEDGDYRAVLYSPGRYLLSVELPGVPGPPFQERYAPYVAEDTVFDIHVPRSGLRVEVRDAVTRKPVPGAEVTILTDYVMDFREPPKRGGGTHGGRSDEDGWAELPPLFPGTAEVQVRKDGYLELQGPVATIEPDRWTELTVDLEPVGDALALELRLPDGRPAAGAELRAQATGWDEAALWRGRADAGGVVEVPERVNGSWLLIRHLEAGSWIQRWSPAGEQPVTWTLSRPAGPVTFKAVALDGDVVPYAGIALRFPETWVAGTSLAWLAESPVAGAGADGLWTAHRLPAERLLVVAGTPETITLARQESLYGNALPIAPPWPAQPIEVTADRRP